jgi:3-dehydroquinate dehydratase/shikimate dehydrogenase
MKHLLQQPRPDVIITNRRQRDGGAFSGTAKQQLDILADAIRNGAEYVDIEMSWGPALVNKVLSLRRKTDIIVSYHNFKETPKTLHTIYQQLKACNCQIIKIATMATTITDCKRMFHLIDNARADRRQIIGLCMGEQGEISRILGGRHGNFLTFAPLNSGQQTAPGQRTIDELINIFHVPVLRKQTKIFGLIGNPVTHSKGIYFHNLAFKRKKVDAVYVNFLTIDLKKFIKLFSQDITGASVTMPFKEDIVPMLDILHGNAADLRVVNTIIRHRDTLHGYNTDLPAITGLIQRHRLKNKNVVILGTGGTSKTMAFASLQLRANTTIIGRSPENAQSLARELNCKWGTFDELSDIPCDVLMNGTSVGMREHDSRTMLVPKKYLRENMVVVDAVSSNDLTPLLQTAKSRGCHLITGNELFQRQAELQSRLFLKNIP